MYLIFIHKFTPSIWCLIEVCQAFFQSKIYQNPRPKIKNTERPKYNANYAPYFFVAS